MTTVFLDFFSDAFVSKSVSGLHFRPENVFKMVFFFQTNLFRWRWFLVYL